jgi:hypothetical protein
MMNLTDRLEELAEAEAPPMEIDITRARESGRRRLRRRRTTLVGGVAVVTLLATVAASALVESAGRSGDVATPADTIPPLTSYATFGWLPPGITRTDFGVGAHGDYTHAANETHTSGTHLWLHVYPAGKMPKLPRFRGRAYFTLPAQPVNGRSAYWATEKQSDPLNNGDAVLLWKAEDGRWVELNAYYLGSFDDPKAVVHRVASAVEVAERAEPLPVAISGMPDRYRISEVTFYRPMARDTGSGAWDLTIFYEVGSRPVFTILVGPEGTRRKAEKLDERVCKASEGIEVCVTVGQFTDPEAIKALGGPNGVLSHFEPLGMDESDWRPR